MQRSGPDLDQIRAMRERLGERIFRTPVVSCPAIADEMAPETKVIAKLELFQQTGTFKARGALATVLGLDSAALERGVVAVSAGNHAIATAYAATTVGTSAKVVMTRSANPARVSACQVLGAEIVIEEDVHRAFDTAKAIEAEEGRAFVHPFDGEAIALGAGTLGLEISEQVPECDALVVPVGGGGLISGVATAVKQALPGVRVYGVEPEGADSMRRSFAAGKAMGIERVNTIADSLGAPFAMPYSFQLARENVDSLVMVSDDELRTAMGFLFDAMKLAVEPACAASTAALLGPLRAALTGQRVVLLFCGSNIDSATFMNLATFDDAD